MTDGVNKIKTETEAAFGNFITVILEILLPVALFFIGLALVGPAVGLSGFYAKLLANAPIPATAVNTASAGVAVLTWIGIGGGFIMVERTYPGWFGDIVGAVGWMSIGAGLREILNFVTVGTPMAPSSILSTASDKLAAGVTAGATAQ